MASQVSAVTIIAVPGAIVRDGGNLLFLQGTLLGFILAKFLMAYLFVKPYYERKIFSPYDFIEYRLGSGAAQTCRGLFLISAILVRLHQGPANQSTYPEEQLTSGSIELTAGNARWVEILIDCQISRPGWHFLVLEANSKVGIRVTETPPGQRWYYPRPADPIRPNPFSNWTSRSLRIGMSRAIDADGATVLEPYWNEFARAQANLSGFLNFAYIAKVTPTQTVFAPDNLINNQARPTNLANLWVSQQTFFDKPKWAQLDWPSPQTIGEVQLLFDSSLHFHFYQSWQGYPVNAIPSV